MNKRGHRGIYTFHSPHLPMGGHFTSQLVPLVSQLACSEEGLRGEIDESPGKGQGSSHGIEGK